MSHNDRELNHIKTTFPYDFHNLKEQILQIVAKTLPKIHQNMGSKYEKYQQWTITEGWLNTIPKQIAKTRYY